MPVHLYGQAAAMGAVEEVARARGCAIVEDAAQAHGATWDGRPVGRFGPRLLLVVRHQERVHR